MTGNAVVHWVWFASFVWGCTFAGLGNMAGVVWCLGIVALIQLDSYVEDWLEDRREARGHPTP